MPNNLKPNIDLLLQTTLRKDSERGVFEQFLASDCGDGTKVIERLSARAGERVSDELPETAKSEVVNATVKSLKDQQLASGLTAFDELVMDLIAANEPSAGFVRNIKTGRASLADVPVYFPGMRKRAEALLLGKISADVKETDIQNHGVQKQLTSLIRSYTKDLFFAANHGLGEKTLAYLQLVFELDELQTSETIPQTGLRRLVAERLLNGQPLEVVHIKSLRFTYPGGKNLRILETTGAAVQEGLADEIRFYPSEEVIFDRLSKVRSVMEKHGLATNLTVIVSDPDLGYCFPEGQTIVSESDVCAGRKSAETYVDFVSQMHPEASVFSLRAFLKSREKLAMFEDLFDSLVQEGDSGGGKLMTAKVLEMRVNSQYEHYKEMFGNYTRGLARRTAIYQIANILSLSTVFEAFSQTPVLIIDSRGFEDQLIGGCNPKSVVKYFTKLKDPMEVRKRT